MWLDAGYTCTSTWSDVCTTDHPLGAQSNSLKVKANRNPNPNPNPNPNASEVHHAVPLPVGAGQYYEAGQYYGTGPQPPYYGAGAGQYQQPAGPAEEDYEVWPSMQDALPPAAELGPQSQRGGGGAPSHRAQHTDVPSQPDYTDKGTYSSAPSFQQRL